MEFATLVILDEEYFDNHGNIKCFLYPESDGSETHYHVENPYLLKFPWDDDYREYYEYVSTKYIKENNTINIGCTGCAGCVGCFNCVNCVNCKNCLFCEKCYDCEGCTFCDDCDGGHLCDFCTSCRNCTGCENCSWCDKRKTGYKNIEDNEFPYPDDE